MKKEEFFNLKIGDRIKLHKDLWGRKVTEAQEYTVAETARYTTASGDEAFSCGAKHGKSSAIKYISYLDHDDVEFADPAIGPVQDSDYGECIWHTYVKYVGFTDIYYFCKHCGKKETA